MIETNLFTFFENWKKMWETKCFPCKKKNLQKNLQKKNQEKKLKKKSRKKMHEKMWFALQTK